METIRVKKKYNDTVIYDGKLFPTKLTKESKELIDEFIRNHTRCVCAYGSTEEYKYSTISTKYTVMDVMDTVASIASIDYDNCEVELELRPECSDPNSYRYLDPKDIDKYDLILRGLVGKTAGSSESDDIEVRIIGFDMIKRKEN